MNCSSEPEHCHSTSTITLSQAASLPTVALLYLQYATFGHPKDTDIRMPASTQPDSHARTCPSHTCLPSNSTLAGTLT